MVLELRGGRGHGVAAPPITHRGETAPPPCRWTGSATTTRRLMAVPRGDEIVHPTAAAVQFDLYDGSSAGAIQCGVHVGGSGEPDRRDRHHAGAQCGWSRTVARKELRSVSGVEGTRLVVSTLTGPARLAWETTVTGTGAEGDSRLTVDVDANTGAVLRTQEHVADGTGTGRLDRGHGHPQHHASPAAPSPCSDPTIDQPQLPGRGQQHDLHRHRRRVGQRRRHQPRDRLRRRAVRRAERERRCCRVARPQRHQRHRRRAGRSGSA